MAATSTISQYLKGIAFPASKEDLISQARQNGAPDEVIQEIQDFPDEQFDSMPQVWHNGTDPPLEDE